MRWLPNTIVGRTLLILIAGLLVSHLVGIAVVSGERFSALTGALGERLATQMEAATGVVEQTGTPLRPTVARRLSGPALNVSWGLESAVSEDDADRGGWRDWMIRRILREYLGDLPSGNRRIAVRQPPTPEDDSQWPPRLHRNWDGVGGMGAMDGGPGHMSHMRRFWRHREVIQVSQRLADGSWLNFTMPMVSAQPFRSSPWLLSFLISAVLVIGVSLWAVRRASAPLDMFARAAERLGRDVDAPAMSEDGPGEVRRAATAFNRMQQRVSGFVRDRTQMLAAISHDLKTPITRLRLRAEFMDDDEQRTKMLADLDQMEAMIAETLAFARDDITAEATRPFDLAVILRDLCEQAADAGEGGAFQGPDRLTYDGRPTALRRAFENLVGNAVKYGGGATVTLREENDDVIVTVDDHGPGLADAELSEVFRPFYRVEGSRSRDTGGVGLGLAVVRSVCRAHGGDVTLANRSEGGLRATVTLPSVAPVG